MNKETTENCTDLIYILQARSVLRAQFLANLSEKLVKTFCELALNVLFGSLTISDEEKKILTKHRSLCEKLSKDSESWRRKLSLINSSPPQLLDVLAQVLQKYV